MTLFWAKQYYEPKFGPVYSLDSVTSMHFAWLEDWLSTATLSAFVCKGYIKEGPSDPAVVKGKGGGRGPGPGRGNARSRI